MSCWGWCCTSSNCPVTTALVKRQTAIAGKIATDRNSRNTSSFSSIHLQQCQKHCLPLQCKSCIHRFDKTNSVFTYWNGKKVSNTKLMQYKKKFKIHMNDGQHQKNWKQKWHSMKHCSLSELQAYFHYRAKSHLHIVIQPGLISKTIYTHLCLPLSASRGNQLAWHSCSGNIRKSPWWKSAYSIADLPPGHQKFSWL